VFSSRSTRLSFLLGVVSTLRFILSGHERDGEPFIPSVLDSEEREDKVDPTLNGSLIRGSSPAVSVGVRGGAGLPCSADMKRGGLRM